MAKLSISGTKKLIAALEKRKDSGPIKKVVQTSGVQLKASIMSHANYSGPYTKGATRRSASMQISNGGYTAEAGVGMNYDPYLETGTRYMRAQPAVRPAYNEVKEKYKSAMEKLMK